MYHRTLSRFAEVLGLVLLSTAFAYAAGPLNDSRYNHTTTLLQEGNILILGGQDSAATFRSTYEIYSSSSASLSKVTAPAGLVRSSHTATLLPNAGVLVAGGANGSGVLATAFVFYSTSSAVATANSLATARKSHTATLLRSGKVLIVGGLDASGQSLASIEIYDPATNSFSVSPNGMLSARYGHTATLLDNGHVFVAGGYNTAGSRYVETTELYDPDSDTWSPGPTLIKYRAYHTATALNNGKVLITGGFNGQDTFYIDTTEAYDPFSNKILPYPPMPYRNSFHTSTLWPDGKVNITGGLGNIADQPFAGPSTVYSSTITITPAAGSYSSGTIVNTSPIYLAFDKTMSVPITGKFSKADMYYANTAADGTTAKIQTPDATITFRDDPSTGSLNGHSFYKGRIWKEIPIVSPEGTVAFSPQLQTVSANGTCYVYGTTVTVVKDAITSIQSVSTCSLSLTITFPRSDYLPTSQIKALRAQIGSGSISNSQATATFDPGGTDNAGIYSATGLSVPLAYDAATGGAKANVTLNFAQLKGTLSAATTITADPYSISSSSAALTLLFDYIVSPIDAKNYSFNTKGSTLSVTTMISADNIDYSPNTASWTFSEPMATPNADGTATVYPTYNHSSLLTTAGDMPVTGGQDCADATCTSHSPLTKFSIYFASVPYSWSGATSMNYARAKHTATLLPDGKVLVAGGTDGTTTLNSAEIYDPPLNSWSLTGLMKDHRSNHTANLLPNGNVLVTGGYRQDTTTGTTNTAEIFYPNTNTWVQTAPMSVARQKHAAVMLPSGASGGNIMVIGGHSDTAYISSCEIYISTSASWIASTALNTARSQHAVTILHNGRILVTGGVNGTAGTLKSAEIFNPATNAWTAAADMATKRHSHSATLLKNGKVLVSGGNDGGGEIASAEIYDPVANTWTAVTDVLNNPARMDHTATLLPNGKVVIIGGVTANDYAMSTVSDYFADYKFWQSQGAISYKRGYHTATLLKNGVILLAGGYDKTSGYTSTVEKSYFMSSPDAADSPTRRQPSSITSDIDTFDHVGTITLRSGTSNFYGITEASGGNGGSANSSHSTPHVYVYMTDTPGSYMLDLSTLPYGGQNTWSKMTSSITFTTPSLPYGWYQFRAATNGQFSDGHMVFVSPARPSGKPQDITGLVLSTSSIAWSWNAGTLASADGYAVFSATGVFISTVSISNPAFTQTDLAPNSKISIAVAGYNITRYSDLAYSATYYTEAETPTNLRIASTTFTTASLTWSSAGNSNLTTYEVSMSADQFQTNFSTPVPFAINYDTTSVTIPNLVPGSTYYFRVRAQNGAGVVSDSYSNIVSTVTIASVNGLEGVATSTTAVRWSWQSTQGAAAYNVYTSTGGLITSIAQSGAPFYVQGSLNPNSPYSVILQAANGGILSQLVPSATVYTSADTPSPYSQGSVSVTTGSMTGYWSPGSNPAGTTYMVDISKDNRFSSILASQSATQSGFVAFVSAYFSSLTPNTSYYMRVQAFNGDNIASAYVSLSSGVYTNALPPRLFQASSVTASSAYLSWDTQDNPSYTEYRIMYSTNNIDFNDKVGFSAGLTASTYTVTGLLTATTYYFQVQSRNKNLLSSAAIPLTPIDHIVTSSGPSDTCIGCLSGFASNGSIQGTLTSGRQVSMSVLPGTFLNSSLEIAVGDSVTDDPCGSGLPTIYIYSTNDEQPRLPVTLTFKYQTSSNNNELAGQDLTKIVLARYSGTPGQCRAVGTTINSASKEVTATLGHFSTFQLMPVTAPTNLASALIYPNPVYPNRGNGLITFDNIPMSSAVRVYTLSGEKVWEGHKDNSSPVVWNGKNPGGEGIASGIYLVLIEGGGEKKILKLAVER